MHGVLFWWNGQGKKLIFGSPLRSCRIFRITGELGAGITGWLRPAMGRSPPAPATEVLLAGLTGQVRWLDSTTAMLFWLSAEPKRLCRHRNDLKASTGFRVPYLGRKEQNPGYPYPGFEPLTFPLVVRRPTICAKRGLCSTWGPSQHFNYLNITLS